MEAKQEEVDRFEQYDTSNFENSRYRGSRTGRNSNGFTSAHKTKNPFIEGGVDENL